MLADRRLHGLEHAGEVDVAIENDDRGLGVAPAQVVEELGDGVQKGLLTAPELALPDEDVAVLDADEDVRLAGEVEASPRYRKTRLAAASISDGAHSHFSQSGLTTIRFG